ncbi:MAG: hypothetical protein HYS22_00315 [Deltaproteobacteria bacterium]|nr:hypothetical protein [Deltaproteobacteria bacterium]
MVTKNRTPLILAFCLSLFLLSCSDDKKEEGTPGPKPVVPGVVVPSPPGGEGDDDLSPGGGGGGTIPPPPVEDCEIEGDENGNGLADCADPACTANIVCQNPGDEPGDGGEGDGGDGDDGIAGDGPAVPGLGSFANSFASQFQNIANQFASIFGVGQPGGGAGGGGTPAPHDCDAPLSLGTEFEIVNGEASAITQGGANSSVAASPPLSIIIWPLLDGERIARADSQYQYQWSQNGAVVSTMRAPGFSYTDSHVGHFVYNLQITDTACGNRIATDTPTVDIYGVGGAAGQGGAGGGGIPPPGEAAVCDVLNGVDLRAEVTSGTPLDPDPGYTVGSGSIRVRFDAYVKKNGSSNWTLNQGNFNYVWRRAGRTIQNNPAAQYESLFSDPGTYEIEVTVSDRCARPTTKWMRRFVIVREPQTGAGGGTGSGSSRGSSQETGETLDFGGGPVDEFAGATGGDIAVAVKIRNSIVSYKIYQTVPQSFRDGWTRLSELHEHLGGCGRGEDLKLTSPSVAITPNGQRILIALHKKCLKNNEVKSQNVVHQEIWYKDGQFRERYDTDRGITMDQTGQKWSPKAICLASGDCAIGYVRYKDEGRLPAWEEQSIFGDTRRAGSYFKHLTTKKVYYKIFPKEGDARGPFRVNASQDSIPGEWRQNIIARDRETQLTAVSCGNDFCFSFIRERRGEANDVLSQSEWFLRMGTNGERRKDTIEHDVLEAPDAMFELKFTSGDNLVKVYRIPPSQERSFDGSLVVTQVTLNNTERFRYDMPSGTEWLAHDRFFFSVNGQLYEIQETGSFSVTVSRVTWNGNLLVESPLESFVTNWGSRQNNSFSYMNTTPDNSTGHYFILWRGTDGDLHGVIRDLP